MNHDVRADLAQRIHATIEGTSTESIESLLLAVHRWQAEHDPVLRSLTQSPVEHWTQIPAVPVDLFKQLPIGTVQEDEEHVLFRTSGTTAGVRGCHRLRDTRLYEHGALTWFRACVPQCPHRRSPHQQASRSNSTDPPSCGGQAESSPACFRRGRGAAAAEKDLSSQRRRH